MGAAPVLTILKDGETVKSHPLEGEAILGRSEGCVIRLNDRAISRQHAVLRPVDGGVRIEKRSEFAPISVNGAECSSALVKEGDIISIGPYLLKLSMSSTGLAPQALAPVLMPIVATEPPPLEPLLDFEEPLESPLAAQPLEPPPAGQISAGTNVAGGSSSPDSIPNLLPLEPVVAQPDIQPVLEAVPGSALEPVLEPQSEALSSPIEAAAVSADSVPVPHFSMEASAPEGSDPIDLGEISIGEHSSTRLVPSAKVSAKLVLPPGVSTVLELEISKEETSIGRGDECDLVLEDKKASRRHAIIRRAGVNFTIKDLDSANGTYVNGSKIGEHALSGDDIIKIGNVEFRFLVLSADYVDHQQDFMPVPQAPEFSASMDPLPPFLQPPPGPPLGMIGPNGTPAGAPSAPEGAEVAGLAGIGGVTRKKKTLFQKYRTLPPRRKAIWTVIIIAALYFAFIDDEPPRIHHVRRATVGSKAPATFDNLSRSQKKFVESQHALAFDYYRNHEYDKAIFEIDKIFALIPDYKDSREIERYAKEGKRKLEALEEEQHKKEEEQRLNAKIAGLVDDANTLMNQKKYDQVEDLFSQILSLDPDNQQVASWRKQVDAYEEQKRIEQEQKEVQEQINARAWDLYKDGMSLKHQKKYGDAIESFRRVAEIGATDKKVQSAAAARIEDIETLVADLRDPVLANAKQAEDAQEYAKAYKLYEQATKIDPSYPAGYAGMDRVRGVLHDEAKALYIQAVLAESYSDFETAKQKYKECLSTAPKDDVYHDRAERKLTAFFGSGDRATASVDSANGGGDGTDSDGGSGPAPADSGGGP